LAKAPYKHPSVFVGCPYEPADDFKEFKAALDGVPIEFLYAESSIKSKHVVDRIRSGITRTDFSLFDITDWNANVTLEVGLAEGLNWKYYILFRPGRGKKKEPPSDLKGLQRFQYKTYGGFDDTALSYQLNHYLVKRLTHPRYVYDRLSGAAREKEFVVAMRILAHFKKYKLLTRKELGALAAGSYLRDDSVAEIIEILLSRKLITGQTDGNKWRLGKDLYKGVEF